MDCFGGLWQTHDQLSLVISVDAELGWEGG